MGTALETVSAPSPAPAPPVPPALSLLRQYLGIERRLDDLATPSQPVFISIDVEAFEFNHDFITEVGIAQLDSRDLTSPAFTSPLEWLGKIRTRHFIIKEYTKFVNKRFVKGCPEKFRFGKSCVVYRAQMQDLLQQAFKIEDPLASEIGQPHHRSVVLVGHQVSGDITYMNKLGFSLDRVPELVGKVDSRQIAGAVRLPENLEKLLRALGEKPKWLHNAGNDAHYTMRAALRLALYGSVLPEPATMETARKDTLRSIEEQKVKMEERRVRQKELTAMEKAEREKQKDDSSHTEEGKKAGVSKEQEPERGVQVQRRAKKRSRDSRPRRTQMPSIARRPKAKRI